MRKYNYLLIGLLVLSIIGNIVFFRLWENISNKNDEFAHVQKRFPYLSKRILQEFPQDILINFLDLRQTLRSQIDPFGNGFGVYFEYLPTGTTIGINEKEEFHAASLFKLPVVMAYYHTKDRTNNQNDTELTLKSNQLDNQFGNLWQKGAGYKLKASDAVWLALTESDNTAAKAIVPLIDKQDFNAVYEGLDIDLQSDKEGAILTAKNYSSILKALYFSSVLSKESSEEILDILTKTKFPDKLAAGIPADIPVAHKIGDYNDEKGNEAFMDCGIVYVTRRPYILCMLSVSDEQTARERMQAVSKTIYDYISDKNR